jgi:hypothetical protein
MTDTKMLADLAALEATAPGDGEGEYIPAAEAAAPQEQSSAEMVGALATVAFAVVAARRGPHWALTAAEAEEFGKAGGAVLDKYAPDLHTGPEAALVLTAGMIVLPRLLTDKQAEKEAAQPKDKDAAPETVKPVQAAPTMAETVKGA